MFAGHLGIALAAARVEPGVPVGVFAAASLLLDLLLWLFILLGWESVVIPADFGATHQPVFDFPWSHGLAASAGWSGLAGGLAVVFAPRGRGARAGLAVAGVVFSHWLLDALVHRPEMPLAGASSLHVGAALWDHMPVALVVEAALVAVGMRLFFAGRGLPRGRRIAVAALMLLTLAFTVAGMTVAPPPPSAAAMAASSLVTIVLVCALIGWSGRGAGTVRG